MKFRLLGQDAAISEAAESYNTYRKLFIGPVSYTHLTLPTNSLV